MIFVVSADEHANWKVVEVVANDNLSVEKRINWSLTQGWRNKVVARNKARSATRCTSGSAGTRTSRSARRWPRSSARTIRSSSVGTRGLQSQGQSQWRTVVLRGRRSVGITKDTSVPPNRQLTMRPLRKYRKKEQDRCFLSRSLYIRASVCSGGGGGCYGSLELFKEPESRF